MLQQHPVRQEAQLCVWSTHIFESNCVPHFLSQLHVHLFRHALSDTCRCDTSGLGTRDHLGARALQERKKLRDLRRLATARFAFHDNHLVPLDRVLDLVEELVHGQLLTLFKERLVAGRDGNLLRGLRPLLGVMEVEEGGGGLSENRLLRFLSGCEELSLRSSLCLRSVMMENDSLRRFIGGDGVTGGWSTVSCWSN